MKLVGVALVRNEDVFVERAIRNVAHVCDRIFAVDHLSTDTTWEILQSLARELDHLDVRRAGHSRVSHDVLQPYVGTPAWALRVDGDELYDPDGLSRMRGSLEQGDFAHLFRVQASVLHCVSLAEDEATATGYLTPPSRACTALYNLEAVSGWPSAPERLHGGEVTFRQGFDWQSVDPLHDRYTFEESPFRYLHVCFLRRSSEDGGEPVLRPNLSETGAHRRGLLGSASRLVRAPRINARTQAVHAQAGDWKTAMYRRGPLVEKDATPFLRGPTAAVESRPASAQPSA